MQAGDILFYKGQGLLGKLICAISGSPYSHVALAVDANHIIEADRFIKTSIIEFHPSNAIVIKRPCPELDYWQQVTLVNYAGTLIGKRYDYASVIKWVFRLVFRTELSSIVNDANRVYCDEVVDRCYQYIGIDLVPYRPEGDVLQSDLFNSPRLCEVKEDY